MSAEKLNQPTLLSTAPLEPLAMDYAFLRQEGMRHLERMAGQAWTDFNAHDPGITILEQLCYALTDLGYRINYDLRDLLASGGRNGSASLYSSAEILATNPVTLTDFRKLVIDVKGVKNAWIEPVEVPEPPVFYDPADQSLYLKEEPHRTPVPLRGVYQVRIQRDRNDKTDTEVIAAVKKRLHACRPLCEDFAEPTIVKEQTITVIATIEVHAVENPDRLLAEIYHALAGAIAPRIRFYSLAERLAQGNSLESIMDGPALNHGFIDTDELEGSERKPGLRTSDLIQVIMNVDGVRVVHDISLSDDGGETKELWYLKLDPEKTPVFVSNHIQLARNGVPVKADPEGVKTNFNDLQQADRPGPLPDTECDIPLPVGRDRAVGNYSSFQHLFPATYGIGAMGLPESATAERKAQAKQLKAYLLLFDQLLANEFTQLAHVKDLFSFDPSPTTYFSQSIDDDDDPTLGLAEIWTNKDPDARRENLQQITEDPSLSQDRDLNNARKHRFLNHLLARFGEEFAEYSLEQEPLIKAKCQFLQEYRTLGADRGKAFDVTQPSGNTNNVSGLEQRISRKLGLSSYRPGELGKLVPDDNAEGRFHLVEHILLRPREADTTPDAKGEGWQAGALSDLSQTQEGLLPRDPYSLQLTFIFPAWMKRFAEHEVEDREKGDPVRDFIRQTMREETPAHLTVYLQWLNKEKMGTFEAAYKGWLANVGEEADMIVARDARDRLIDLLHMGTPYPLRDLKLEYTKKVSEEGSSTDIHIIGAQTGVEYRLCDEEGKAINGVNDKGIQYGSPQKVGADHTCTLATPSIEGDITFTILASRTTDAYGKTLASAPETYLTTSMSIGVGYEDRGVGISRIEVDFVVGPASKATAKPPSKRPT